MYTFLRNYRATPHCTTGYARTKALFGRSMNIQIPTAGNRPIETFDPDLMRKTDFQNKAKIKQSAENARVIKQSDIEIGDYVLVKQKRENKFTKPVDSTPMLVIKKNKSMITAQSNDKCITRNSSHFKKITTPAKEEKEHNVSQKLEHVNWRESQQNTQVATRSSTRQIKQPHRLLEQM